MPKKQIFQHSINMAQPASSLQQALNEAVRQHQRGNLAAAEQIYRKILQREPKHGYVLNLLGVLFSQKGNHQEGEVLIARAIALDPKVADYHNNLGLTLEQLGRLKEAAKSFKKATQIDPGFTPAWFALGNVSVYLKDAETAIAAYQRVIQNDPGFSPAYNNLGNVYREIRRYADAHKMFDKVIELKPDFVEAWYNIGALYKAEEDGEKAVAALDQAISLQPGYLRAFIKRGRCRHLLLNDMEGAVRDYDHVLGTDPAYVPAYIYKADVFQQQGKFDKAEEILRKALEINETSLAAYYALVDTKKYIESDLHKLQAIMDDADLDTLELSELHFILTKIFNDRGDYAKAFHHMQEGNQLYRSTYAWRIDIPDKDFSRLTAVFDEVCIGRNAAHGSDSDVPVFIVGMPRSGTTLIEQIISAHPEAFGAGELIFMSKMVEDLSRREGHAYPECMAHFPPAETTALANSYLTHLGKLNDAAARITDKMPENFKHIGLIAALFPRARIIHCRRNPLDTCLSIYERKFTGEHPYAYDLTELGWYYRHYLRLMAHWEQVLPGRILTVRYEDLVEHQETMSHKLIDYVGLEWDERCLQFYNSERSVKTASQWQVRQKVYTTSKERWRNYEPWLGPLIEALGDAVTDIKM